MIDRLHRIGRAAVATAIRIRMEPPLGALLMGLVAGYLLFCMVIYARIAG